MLALNKYKNMCTNNNWLGKSPGEQYIVVLSAELEKMKDIKLKLKKSSTSEGHERLIPTSKLIKKGTRTPHKNRRTTTSTLGRKNPPNKAKRRQ